MTIISRKTTLEKRIWFRSCILLLMILAVVVAWPHGGFFRSRKHHRRHLHGGSGGVDRQERVRAFGSTSVESDARRGGHGLDKSSSWFDMEVQRQEMAQRFRQHQPPPQEPLQRLDDDDEANAWKDMSAILSDVESLQKRSYVVEYDIMDMEKQRRDLAEKYHPRNMAQPSTSTRTTTSSSNLTTAAQESSSTITESSQYGEEGSHDATTTSAQTTEVVVQADFAAPLAQPRPLNLYRVGFELQAEEQKTVLQRAAAQDLENKIQQLQQQQRTRIAQLRQEALQRTMVTREEEDDDDDDDGTNATTAASPEDKDVDRNVNTTSMFDVNTNASVSASPSLVDTVDQELQQAAARLTKATEQSTKRLSAFERTRALLLEMQAEVDDLEERVKQAATGGGMVAASSEMRNATRNGELAEDDT